MAKRTPKAPQQPDPPLIDAGNSGDIVDTFGELPAAGAQPPQTPTPDATLQNTAGAVTTPPAAIPPAQPGDDLASPDATTTTIETNDTALDFPPELLSRAGLTPEAAKATFGSADGLSAAMDFADQQLARRMLAVADQAQPAAPAQPVTPAVATPRQEPAPQTPPPTPGEGEVKVVPFKFPTAEEADWLDDDSRALLGKIVDHYNGQLSALTQSQATQLASLQARIEGTQTFVQEQQAQQYVQQMDGLFDSLGDEWRELFGQGPGRSLSSDSPQIKNRVNVDNALRKINAGMRLSNMPASGLPELFRLALAATFPSQQATAAVSAATGKIAKRQSQFTQRPGARKGAPVSGREKALSNADQFFADRGISPKLDSNAIAEL